MRTRLQVMAGILGSASTLVLAASAPLPDGVVARDTSVTGAYIRMEGTVLAALPEKLIETWRDMCPVVHKKALVVSGPSSALGTVKTDVYLRKDQTASYTTAHHLVQDKDDPCAMRIEARQSVRITTFDGQRTVMVQIDMTLRQGKRSWVPGRAPLLSHTAAIHQAGALAAAPTLGTDHVAMRTCEIKRIERQGMVTEACLLKDAQEDASLRGLPLRHATSSVKGGLISRGEATTLAENTKIDTGVFAIPAGVMIASTVGQHP